MKEKLSLKRIRRIILLIFLCLFLTACQKIGSSTAITGADHTESSISPIPETETLPVVTEAYEETEPRVLMARPFAYQVDLTHDGMPELLIVDELIKEETAQIGVSLVKGEQTIWADDLEITDQVTRKAYFLCSVGSEDYLIFYRVYIEGNSYRYIAEVFYLSEDGQIIYVDNDGLSFATDSYEDYPLDGSDIAGFSRWLNWYLERSTLLCGNENGQYIYSMTDAQHQYREEFAELFALTDDYSGCTTVSDKVNRLNEYLYQQWFSDVDPEGKNRTAPPGFYDTAKRIVEAARPTIWMGEELQSGTALWFNDYNGKNLQFILGDETYTTPLSCNDAIYYRAKKDETVEEVARYMVERMIAEMTVPSDNRPFTVTNYRIPAQKLNTLDDGIRKCWQSYCWETKTNEITMETYLWDWLGYADVMYGFVPVNENMWYFCPQGYFSFEGECADGKTMNDLTEDSREVVGGKVPFVIEEDPMSVQFILMKRGTVYRLQRAEAMAAMYPRLLEESSEQSGTEQWEDE